MSWSELAAQAGTAPGGGGDFEPLPNGDYDVEVEKATPTTASTGKKMFKITFRVTDGPYAGKRAFDNLVLVTDNANALSWFFQKMGTMGLDQAYFAGNPTDDLIASALVGRKLRVKLSQRTWQGKVSNEVKQYMPASGGPQVATAAAGVPAPPAVPGASVPPAGAAPAAQPQAPAAPPAPPQQAGAPAPPPAPF
jgi:hypothetical protein